MYKYSYRRCNSTTEISFKQKKECSLRRLNIKKDTPKIFFVSIASFYNLFKFLPKRIYKWKV